MLEFGGEQVEQHVPARIGEQVGRKVGVAHAPRAEHVANAAGVGCSDELARHLRAVAAHRLARATEARLHAIGGDPRQRLGEARHLFVELMKSCVGVVSAIVLNSGGANCYTGMLGFQVVHETAEAAGRAAGLSPYEILVGLRLRVPRQYRDG